MTRQPHHHHTTSEPRHFVGRNSELATLDQTLVDPGQSLVAMIGPGGQGKTAITQHWLHRLDQRREPLDGLFLWSFYRGKDSDVFLRELLAYAQRLTTLPDVSASYCVDQLLSLLRVERWVLVLDGTEVVQHETGTWFGRFVHPELARLLEELASAPMPGVALVTTRFPLPTLTNRRHAQILPLSVLDTESAASLLTSFGVEGSKDELQAAASACGLHAKAVELLATLLRLFHDGQASAYRCLPPLHLGDHASDEEQHVLRILDAYRNVLAVESQDIIALATAFRQPPTESQLLQFLLSGSVRNMLTRLWQRTYPPFDERPAAWLAEQVQYLVDLRLLERVGTPSQESIIDAHPLVRAGFEHHDAQQTARARAGFLHARPDRRPPDSIDETRHEVELFHAYCDAALWNEADGVYVALDNPKHRFLAPAFERDLLLRFFPNSDWRQTPLWPGFGRYRSLAICFELLGQFEDAIEAYRPSDAPLRGDALIASGQWRPILATPQVANPWQPLWQAYRAHALCLAGRVAEGVALAGNLIPLDVYEWVHVFECLLRAGSLVSLDLNSILYRAPQSSEHQWAALARRRMQADFIRLTRSQELDLRSEYEALLEAYDKAGLPYERALTRLGYARFLLSTDAIEEARSVNAVTSDLAERFQMPIVAADVLAVDTVIAKMTGEEPLRVSLENRLQTQREQHGFSGPTRP